MRVLFSIDGIPKYLVDDETVYERGEPVFYIDDGIVYDIRNGVAKWWINDDHLFEYGTGQPKFYFGPDDEVGEPEVEE
jgi:hypothetical protein